MLRSAADFQRQYGRRHRFQFAHIRAYAICPYSWRRKTNTKRNDPSPYPQRTKSKYVGAYRIRPPHERIWPTKELIIMKLTGKTLLGFRGTFPQTGKPCPVSGEHFPKRENLARFQGNIFPSGKTLPGFRGTFPQAGKPCSVSEGHFPGRENLARFPRNISPGGKTLLGFRGTFSQAGKPCPVSEEHFPGWENLARFPRNISPGGKTLLDTRE